MTTHASEACAPIRECNNIDYVYRLPEWWGSVPRFGNKLVIVCFVQHISHNLNTFGALHNFDALLGQVLPDYRDVPCRAILRYRMVSKAACYHTHVEIRAVAWERKFLLGE